MFVQYNRFNFGLYKFTSVVQLQNSMYNLLLPVIFDQFFDILILQVCILHSENPLSTISHFIFV